MAIDEREQRSIEVFRDELTQLDRPCDENADRTHVTASAIVVGQRGVLLQRTPERANVWTVPGGHIGRGERTADAAIREVLERSGLAVRHFCGDEHPFVVHVDVNPGPRGHSHLDLRYLVVAAGEPIAIKGQLEAAWSSWTDAAASAGPEVSGIISALKNVTLRAAEPADAPALAELYLRSFRLAYDATDVRLAHDDGDVRRWMREDLLPGHTVTVAVAAGSVPVGFIGEAPGLVSHLYVDPAWTRQGIGSRLLRHAMDHQLTGLSLWTFEANAGARAFYEKHGFAAVEHTDGSGNDEGQPDVRYAWKK